VAIGLGLVGGAVAKPGIVNVLEVGLLALPIAIGVGIGEVLAVPRRYDAEQTAAARLKEALELDPVRDDLAGVVQLTLEPPTSRYRSGHQTELAIADRNQ
jgi:hypothetical protein